MYAVSQVRSRSSGHLPVATADFIGSSLSVEHATTAHAGSSPLQVSLSPSTSDSHPSWDRFKWYSRPAAGKSSHLSRLAYITPMPHNPALDRWGVIRTAGKKQMSHRRHLNIIPRLSHRPIRYSTSRQITNPSSTDSALSTAKFPWAMRTVSHHLISAPLKPTDAPPSPIPGHPRFMHQACPASKDVGAAAVPHRAYGNHSKSTG
ncbi:hypothetical protein BDP55DRAFT_635033 [Colletotrichum godetiae]|uniref:Uncharacterized protein n=1 Tax=Colletotrichum godetiae TaxID=1209918 RepID=A0AAJ0AE82_9PEZI|nr:uncharacterized protein BDP55DRAFT_635033 [Colletotrichum godetiae]KAK1672288.1 hypothetical protein BDP55DRAFT_635033 [Colletotrichum godetiae]